MQCAFAFASCFGFSGYAPYHQLARDMASPAFELLSQRLASKCACQTMFTAASRRHASSSSSSSAAASTSSKKADNISRNIAFLRSDLSRGAGVGKIWRRLNILNDISPSCIPSDLLAASIPILLNSYDKDLGIHRRATHTTGISQERYIRLQEEAEQLYARYRFICNYLENNGEKPLSSKSAFRWAKAFEELGYAPAAWRIWNDRVRIAEEARIAGVAKGEDGLKYLAHSVLVASIRYLKLRKGAEDQQALRAQVCCNLHV